jgi:hypothetical protein
MTSQQKFEEINWHAGFEATFANMVSLRHGYFFAIAGRRFESHWGIGVRLFDHFQPTFLTLFLKTRANLPISFFWYCISYKIYLYHATQFHTTIDSETITPVCRDLQAHLTASWLFA